MSEENISIPSILIVAPPSVRSSARLLRDKLAEDHSMSAAWWNVKRYIDNEWQLTGFQPIISIAKPKENRITKAFYEEMDKKENTKAYTILTGYNKAVIWGEGDRTTTLAGTQKFIDDHLSGWVKSLKEG